MFFLLQFVMSFYRNKRISMWRKYTNFHVWKGSLFIVLYHAFGPSIRSKFVKHNAWNYLLLYQGGVLLPRNVIDGLELLESNKYQVEFDPGRIELVSTCEKIKFLHKIVIKTYFKTSVLRFGTNLLEEGGYDVNCIWVKWRMTNAPCWCSFFYLNKGPMLCKIGWPNCVCA